MKMSCRRFLVIGTGFIGKEVIRRLRSSGHEVTVCSAPRMQAAKTATPDDLLALAYKHPAADSLALLAKEQDCIVIAAGLAVPDATASAALFGANALLPGVVGVAGTRSGVRRIIHVSSAAVQGRTAALTEVTRTSPFSAYSRSKALGEQVLFGTATPGGPEMIVIRATSVHGNDRQTTAALRRVARSRLSTVARPGTQPSAVSSVGTLAYLVEAVGTSPDSLPAVILQPWEGLSVSDVLSAAGGRRPIRVPQLLCRGAISLGYAVSRVAGHRLDGLVRRVEVMWFGQRVEAVWAHDLIDVVQAKRSLMALLAGKAVVDGDGGLPR